MSPKKGETVSVAPPSFPRWMTGGSLVAANRTSFPLAISLTWSGWHKIQGLPPLIKIPHTTVYYVVYT